MNMYVQRQSMKKTSSKKDIFYFVSGNLYINSKGIKFIEIKRYMLKDLSTGDIWRILKMGGYDFIVAEKDG